MEDDLIEYELIKKRDNKQNSNIYDLKMNSNEFNTPNYNQRFRVAQNSSNTNVMDIDSS
jgi:hypothetical protein